MRRTVLLAAAAFGLLLLRPARGAAQTGAISGHVADSTGRALARATASLTGTGSRASSDERGHFDLRGIAPGTYTLQVRMIGFLPSSTTVSVTAGATATVDVTLAQAP